MRLLPKCQPRRHLLDLDTFRRRWKVVAMNLTNLHASMQLATRLFR